MNAPLDFKAKIVAELQERLADALSEEDQDAIADALVIEAGDLETLCARALREAKTAEAMAEGVKAIMADNKARKDRLEAKADKIRAAVAHAMQEAGLPKINAPDLTASWRMGKPGLSFTRRPEKDDFSAGFATAKYSWDTAAIWDCIGRNGAPDFVSVGNAQPIITVRSK